MTGSTVDIAINGRFLTNDQSGTNGVLRVAEQMLIAVCELVRQRDDIRIEILCPPDIARELPVDGVPHRKVGRNTSHRWEQIDLPCAAGDRTIVSLCNLGPALSRNSVTMVHDAQVFLSPQSYSWGFRTYYKTLYRLIGRRHKKVLTVSAFSKAQLVELGIAPAEKIDVIHNGIDHLKDVGSSNEVFDRLPLEPRSYVCALSNPQAHKNLTVLFDAFERIDNNNIRLVLIGNHDRDSHHAAGLSPPQDTIFTGRVDDAQLRGLIERSLCFVTPSTTEGFGLPPLEAMAVGAPAIVAPCGALPEVCGDAALYARPDKPDEWAQAIMSLHTQPTLFDQMAVAGKAHAEQFTWARAAKQLLDVVTDVAQSDRFVA